jgi:hypothetical protein
VFTSYPATLWGNQIYSWLFPLALCKIRYVIAISKYCAVNTSKYSCLPQSYKVIGLCESVWSVWSKRGKRLPGLRNNVHCDVCYTLQCVKCMWSSRGKGCPVCAIIYTEVYVIHHLVWSACEVVGVKGCLVWAIKYTVVYVIHHGVWRACEVVGVKGCPVCAITYTVVYVIHYGVWSACEVVGVKGCPVCAIKYTMVHVIHYGPKPELSLCSM